jgi:hypothetical protein
MAMTLVRAVAVVCSVLVGACAFSPAVTQAVRTAAEGNGQWEETGTGNAPRYGALYGGEFRDILNDARAPQMDSMGYDAVRFSSQPALGGDGYVILIVRQERYADVSWYRGHPRMGWQRSRHIRFRISEQDYQTVANNVDGYLASAEQNDRLAPPCSAEDEDCAMIVCGDGPGYLTERIHEGRSTWMRGFSCTTDEHPNDLIAAYLSRWVFERLGRE